MDYMLLSLLMAMNAFCKSFNWIVTRVLLRR